jgi:hypothetical protein
MTHILQKSAIAVFGLLPSIYVLYFVASLSLSQIASLNGGSATRMIAAIFSCLLCLYGIYGIIGYLIGRKLRAHHVSMLCGAGGMFLVAIAPMAFWVLEHVGVYDLPNRSGLETYGLLTGSSIVAVPPLLTFVFLAVRPRSATA